MAKVMSVLTLGFVCCIAFGMFVITPCKAYDLESILGVWLFDEDGGSEVEDSSGKGHNGSITGATNWVVGKFGSALKFTSGKVTVPHADDLTTPTFTIMAWINVPQPTASWQVILGKDGWPNRNYLICIHSNAGLIHFAFCAPGQQDIGNFNSVSDVADGKWHHVVGTYDLEMRRIYIDGVLDNEAPSSIVPSENNIPVEMGINLSGSIDEVLVANQAFSENDIKRAMEDGLSASILSGMAVSASDKLAGTWGAIKEGVQSFR